MNNRSVLAIVLAVPQQASAWRRQIRLRNGNQNEASGLVVAQAPNEESFFPPEEKTDLNVGVIHHIKTSSIAINIIEYPYRRNKVTYVLFTVS